MTDHRSKIGLYEFDVAADRMRLVGFIADLANLRSYQCQGKIHSEIIEGPDGCLYLAKGNNSNAGYDPNYAESRLSGAILRMCFRGT